MTFTAPPTTGEMEKLSDFIGQYGVLEPIHPKLFEQRTRFGTAGAVWDCILWVLEKDKLVPHTGIRIFNKRMVSTLDVAAKTNAPIAGLIQKGTGEDNTPKVILVIDDSPNMGLMARLWKDITHPSAEPQRPRVPASEEEEPF